LDTLSVGHVPTCPLRFPSSDNKRKAIGLKWIDSLVKLRFNKQPLNWMKLLYHYSVAMKLCRKKGSEQRPAKRSWGLQAKKEPWERKPTTLFRSLSFCLRADSIVEQQVGNNESPFIGFGFHFVSLFR
jgi:hypothetical protein